MPAINASTDASRTVGIYVLQTLANTLKAMYRVRQALPRVANGRKQICISPLVRYLDLSEDARIVA